MAQRAVAEVDLGAIRQNIGEIRSLIGLRVAIMAVVKADAYGHGMAEVARIAVEAGAEWLGAGTLTEAIALHKLVPAANIHLLTPFCYDEAEEIILNGIVPLVSDIDGARVLSTIAHKLRGGAKVHIDVDTGMGRSGVLPDGAGRLADQISRLPAILVTGMSTHFPSAEDDPIFTAQQLAKFKSAQEAVSYSDTQLKHVHCANSAALLRYPGCRFNLVRPGLLLYGICPPLPDEVVIPPLRPALSVKTRIHLIRTVPAQHPISYAKTFVTSRPTRVATLPVGYGDGWPRTLSNAGEVLVAGKRAPIIGRVCMDMMLIDVTDIPAANVSSEVVLIGSQGEDRITVEEVARAAQTTEHQITTCLLPRLSRNYVDNPAPPPPPPSS